MLLTQIGKGQLNCSDTMKKMQMGMGDYENERESRESANISRCTFFLTFSPFVSSCVLCICSYLI